MAFVFSLVWNLIGYQLISDFESMVTLYVLAITFANASILNDGFCAQIQQNSSKVWSDIAQVGLWGPTPRL